MRQSACQARTYHAEWGVDHVPIVQPFRLNFMEVPLNGHWRSCLAVSEISVTRISACGKCCLNHRCSAGLWCPARMRFVVGGMFADEPYYGFCRENHVEASACCRFLGLTDRSHSREPQEYLVA